MIESGVPHFNLDSFPPNWFGKTSFNPLGGNS